jgi:hypothetical protein
MHRLPRPHSQRTGRERVGAVRLDAGRASYKASRTRVWARAQTRHAPRPSVRAMHEHRPLIGLRALCAAVLFTLAAPAQAQDAASLAAHHVALRDALAHSAFERPLVLESSEAAGALKGDIYARVDQPFARLASAMQGIDHWCEILTLHLNVKHCSASAAGPDAQLSVLVGSKSDQSLADAYRFEFGYKVAAREADYLQVALEAAEGPLGTSHYRIVLEATPIDGQHSFLRLSYAYDQGPAARLAMQAYLATAGRGKVGFSIVGRQPNGAPIFIGNLRGVIERNTMRYYLAIEAYLGALSLPPAQRFERRLADWHAGIERYPLQLHELALDEYLDIKRAQALRQQAQPG